VLGSYIVGESRKIRAPRECGTHSSISFSFFVCRYSNMIYFVIFMMLLHNALHSADIKTYLAPRRWWSKYNSRWLLLSRFFGLEKSAHKLPAARASTMYCKLSEFYWVSCMHVCSRWCMLSNLLHTVIQWMRIIVVRKNDHAVNTARPTVLTCLKSVVPCLSLPFINSPYK